MNPSLLDPTILGSGGAASSTFGVELMFGAFLVALLTLALGRKETRRRR